MEKDSSKKVDKATEAPASKQGAAEEEKKIEIDLDAIPPGCGISKNTFEIARRGTTCSTD